MKPEWIFNEYIGGCGYYGYHIRDDSFSCVYCSLLMYYNKDGEEWGEALVPPVGID